MGVMTNRRPVVMQDQAQPVRHLSVVAPTPNQIRQHMLRRIGVFEEINGEFIGHIAALNFKCRAVIRENPYRTCSAEPEYVVQIQADAELFQPDLGYAWDKNTDGTNVPYKSVHLDDPSFSKTLCAVLVKGPKNIHYLYWDRVTISDDDIERVYITEELMPYTGVLRPIDKPTEYLLSIYPLLREQLGYDYDD